MKMVENKFPYAEGASINKSSKFGVVNYQFQKVRMNIFIQSIDQGIWDAIANGYFVPKHVIDDELVENPWVDWFEMENKEISI